MIKQDLNFILDLSKDPQKRMVNAGYGQMSGKVDNFLFDENWTF